MDQNYEVKYVGDLDLEAAYDDIEEPLTESVSGYFVHRRLFRSRIVKSLLPATWVGRV